MKKIVLFLILITSFLSCSLDDDSPTYTYEILPVDSYVVPASFTLGQTYEIKLKYQKPTSCHIYQGIYYEKNLNTRTIAVQTAVQNNQVCTMEIPPISEVSFNFMVTNTGSYIFKFYKGKDTAGEDIFEDVEIPVVP
ncbi:hypothetical protein FNW25_06995 [Flavobacterium franklandianum]|uniref:hypothetical protein n=1 Tax=Flavobacterium franklandianum TaxID=2594430 RepID=UPI00117AECF9|nr:hypothetical protein [Flavobacterium franklandianum]TRX27000.1 hypothetical protein FNW25_06995 [Flavobacterium franklandianum]